MAAGGTAEVGTKANTPGHRIAACWMFVTVDRDGDEGLPAFMDDDVWMPLVCTDEARVASLRKMAGDIAHATGQRIELRRFAGPVEVLEVFGA